jgi:hypothetical protein
MNPNEVIALSLITQRGNVRETTEFSDKELRFVSLEPTEASLPTVSFAWPGAHLTDAMKKDVASLTPADHATNERYRHLLTVRTAQTSATTTWDSGAESPELRKLRESLQCVGGLRIDAAKKALAAADAALAHQAYEDAIGSARRGLRVLGNLYWVPNSRDDSGMRLEAARAEHLQGHADRCAATMRKVLDSRITLYGERKLPT